MDIGALTSRLLLTAGKAAVLNMTRERKHKS
jgi:hypothetical protein